MLSNKNNSRFIKLPSLCKICLHLLFSPRNAEVNFFSIEDKNKSRQLVAISEAIHIAGDNSITENLYQILDQIDPKFLDSSLKYSTINIKEFEINSVFFDMIGS